jgi:mono/diheme cytochrome c family protein
MQTWQGVDATHGGELVHRRYHTMMREFKALPVLIAALSISGSAFAADPIHGEELARRWCAECHVVARDQRQVLGQAPPFSAVARNPEFNVDRLAYFLLEPHPKMPSMSLTRREAADLASCIASLK